MAKKMEVSPLQIRQFILNLEKNYNLTIRCYDSEDYCLVCIDKEKRSKDERD